VSVAPQEPVTGTGRPAVCTARSSSRRRRAAGSAAAALNISRSREKKRAANAASASRAGTSWAYPGGAGGEQDLRDRVAGHGGAGGGDAGAGHGGHEVGEPFGSRPGPGPHDGGHRADRVQRRREPLRVVG